MKTALTISIGAVLLAAGSAHATILANWAFPTTVPPTSSNFQFAWPINADFNLNAGPATLDADGLKWNGNPAATGNDQGLYQYFTGTTINAMGADPAGSGLSVRSLLGLANGTSLTFCFDNTGYMDTMISFADRATSTGAATVAISVSSDNVTYTPVTSYNTVRDSTFRLQSFDLSSESSIDNDATAYVRLTLTGFSTTSSTGAFRIDNFRIEGTAIPTPGALALLGLGGLVIARRRR